MGSKADGKRDVSDVVSIVGPGMKVEGDCVTDGTVRVEGRVEGSIQAEKAVVVGKDGEIVGDVETQDAVIAGRVAGTIVARSRLELKSSCRVEADIRSRRVTLEEGGFVEGRIVMGEGGDTKRPDAKGGASKGASSPQASAPSLAGREGGG